MIGPSAATEPWIPRIGSLPAAWKRNGITGFAIWPPPKRSCVGASYSGRADWDEEQLKLLRTLLEEVILNLKRAEGHAHLTLRWRGGAITTLDVRVPRFRPGVPDKHG